MSTTAAWTVLVVSGLFETVWAVGLPRTDGFTRLGPSALVLAAMAVSIYGLSLATRTLPVGTAIVGMAVLGEPRTVARLACLGLILAGIVGLKLVGHEG